MNSNELFAREKKAAKLAAVLVKCGATEEDVLNATPEQWAMAAEAAGCHPPHSQATIDLVLKFMQQKEVVEEQTSDVRAEGGFGSPFGNYKTAQQEADEAEAAEREAEDKWEESQEYAGNRCPPRE